VIVKKTKYLILFLFINFGGLALGSWLMNNGPNTDWYLNLTKAPWTPPGWVFGAAWTSIMICFSIYLIFLFTKNYNQKKLFLFGIQFILNVSWNYLFFNKHEIFISLISITLLTALIFFLFFHYYKALKKVSYLLLPYMIWLCIATSLNLYILIHN
jgi:tryptophan-rich sensory protein